MDNDTTGLAAYDDEIDLRELFSVLWEGKRTIALVTALFRRDISFSRFVLTE